MAWTLPRLLRRLRPACAHFQHALPLGYHGRAVVTLHDLHFERDPGVMGPLDRFVFKRVVPRAARGADRVLAVSERTKADAVELYGIAPGKVIVTPHGVDPVFGPGDGDTDGYLLFVGAVQERKDPLAALAAAHAVGLPLVVAGPEKEPRLARQLRTGGADVRGFVTPSELATLYRRADALVLPSRYEGFGIPVIEAMASGTPAVISGDAALVEVAGVRPRSRRTATSAGRSSACSPTATAMSRRGCSGRATSPGVRPRGGPPKPTAVFCRESRRDRRLARPSGGARAIAARPRAPGRRARGDRQRSRLRARGDRRRVQRPPARIRGERQPRRRDDRSGARRLGEPGRRSQAWRGRRAPVVHGGSSDVAASPDRAWCFPTAAGNLRGGGSRPCSGRSCGAPRYGSSSRSDTTSTSTRRRPRRRCRPTGCWAAS